MKNHIVLVEPEIPQNTGNISRSCAATDSVLHLVHPLGFEISDRQLKRAGLDYWPLLEIHEHENLQAALRYLDGLPFFLASTKGRHSYTELQYPQGCALFFGRETAGLPLDFLQQYAASSIRIPIRPEARSLNLSNSVAIVLFEALRQQGFPHLKEEGWL